MSDSDLIQIQRKRRQQGRCIQCGQPTPRAALCKACRQALRYCPRCEAIYPASAASQRDTGRSTSYCLPCSNLVRNGERVPRAMWRVQTAARAHPKLARIQRLYRNGLTYPQIAAAVGLSTGGLSALIAHARRTGRWPRRLRREQT